MFSSEIKETIYIAISLILVAAILGLVSFVMDIRSDFASVQNQEIAAQTEMSSYLRFNKYQGSVIYGEDVIALIREFADTDVAVYIPELRCKNNTTMSGFYMNRDIYLANPNKFSMDTLEFGMNSSWIPDGVSREATYFCFLVFGKYTDAEIKSSNYVERGFTNAYVNYADVTGVVVRKICDTRCRYLSSLPVGAGDCGCELGLNCKWATVKSKVDNWRKPT